MNSWQLLYYTFSLKIIQPPKNLFFNHIVYLKSSHIRDTDMLSLINMVNSHLFTENGISFNSGKLRLFCIFNYCNLFIIKSTRINLSYVNYCLFTFKLRNQNQHQGVWLCELSANVDFSYEDIKNSFFPLFVRAFEYLVVQLSHVCIF